MRTQNGRTTSEDRVSLSYKTNYSLTTLAITNLDIYSTDLITHPHKNLHTTAHSVLYIIANNNNKKNHNTQDV